MISLFSRSIRFTIADLRPFVSVSGDVEASGFREASGFGLASGDGITTGDDDTDGLGVGDAEGAGVAAGVAEGPFDFFPPSDCAAADTAAPPGRVWATHETKDPWLSHCPFASHSTSTFTLISTSFVEMFSWWAKAGVTKRTRISAAIGSAFDIQVIKRRRAGNVTIACNLNYLVLEFLATGDSNN